jgi:superfamily II DNA/RNA helicase
MRLIANGQVLIFVGRKEGVDALVSNLQGDDFKVGGMHGDMTQGERDRVIRGYKKGDIRLMIATDIAGTLQLPSLDSIADSCLL